MPTQGQTVLVGGKRSKVGGRTRLYNASGLAPCCCGGGGPGTWPTTGWIVGTPCPSSVGADKPVIMRASDLTTSPLWTGTGLPFTCFAEKFYNTTQNKIGCATFTSSGTVLTLTEAQASSGDYYPVTTATGLGYNPYDCCTCTSSLSSPPCASGGYSPGTLEDPGSPFSYANVPITYSIPGVKESWSPGADCVYRCCCPTPGDGRSESHDVLMEYEAHTVYAPGGTIKRIDQTETISGSGTLAAPFDDITYAGTNSTTTTFDDDSTSTGGGSTTLFVGFLNCTAHIVSLANFMSKAPQQAVGTITVACDSFSVALTWDYVDEFGDHRFGSLTMSETITRSGDCSANCANAAGCESGAAMFALIGDMLYEA